VLTLPRLWAAAVLACIFAAVAFTWVHPADFWWHVRLGEAVIDGWGIPRVDTFTFTAEGSRFLHQAWLAGAVLAALHRAGGPELVVMANALAFTAAYDLVLDTARRIAGSLRAAAGATALGFTASLENWAVRPQTFSVLLLVLTCLLLWRWRLGQLSSRWLAVLPLMTAVGANLHGAFITGLLAQAAILGVALVERLVEARAPGNLQRAAGLPLGPLVAAGAASGLASLATPYGAGLYEYVGTIARDPTIRVLIVEWRTPTLESTPGRALALVLLVIAVAATARRRLPDPAALACTLAFGALALTAIRHILWFGFAAVFVLAFILRREPELTTAPSPHPRHRVLGVIVALVLAGVCLVALPWVRGALPLPPERRSLLTPDTPVALAGALATGPGMGRVFADMQYASYLAWRLPGGGRLFIDPRVELFGAERWREYGTIPFGRAPELLDTHRIEHLLLDRTRQPDLVAWAAAHPQWKLDAATPQSVLFSRRPTHPVRNPL